MKALPFPATFPGVESRFPSGGQPAPNVFNDFQAAADGAAEDEDSAHEVEEEADEGTELEPRRTQGNGGGQAVFCPPDEPDCCDDLPAGIECYQA